MAVVERERRKGVGAALVAALADEAAERFSALTLNVHLRNPATHLYTRTGFTVSGAGPSPAPGAALRSGDEPTASGRQRGVTFAPDMARSWGW